MAKSQEKSPADASAELAAAYDRASSAVYSNCGDPAENRRQALADAEAARQKAVQDIQPFLGGIASM
jgi:hypothetical protein